MDGSHDMEASGYVLHLVWRVMIVNGEDHNVPYVEVMDLNPMQ